MHPPRRKPGVQRALGNLYFCEVTVLLTIRDPRWHALHGRSFIFFTKMDKLQNHIYNDDDQGELRQGQQLI